MITLLQMHKNDTVLSHFKPTVKILKIGTPEIPYLPYIFGRIKIIIFFTVRTFNLEKNYNFFSVRIFMNAEKLPIIEGIHRYIGVKINNLFNCMLFYQLEYM